MNKTEYIKCESVSTEACTRGEQVRLPSRLLKIYYERERMSGGARAPMQHTHTSVRPFNGLGEGEPSQAMKVFAHLSRCLCISHHRSRGRTSGCVCVLCVRVRAVHEQGACIHTHPWLASPPTPLDDARECLCHCGLSLRCQRVARTHTYTHPHTHSPRRIRTNDFNL